MSNESGTDKREFLRYKCDQPVSFKVVSSVQSPGAVSKALDAVARNLSACGVLFTSTFIPEMSSIIVLDLDYRTTRICQEIEENALIVNNRIVGKVVRVEEDEDGLYGIGVAFIKRLSRLPKELETVIAQP